MNTTRYAIVSGARSAQEIYAYLPTNYAILTDAASDHDGLPVYLISGTDNAGWTLDGYVIPRLGSGGMGCRELVPGP